MHFELQPVEISNELLAQLPKKIDAANLFKVYNGTDYLGYVYVDQAPSKTAMFDYLVVF